RLYLLQQPSRTRTRLSTLASVPNPELLDPLRARSNAVGPLLSAARAAKRIAWRERAGILALLAVLLLICFGKPLFDLARFARQSELYSHILLIPFISAYLIWLKRQDLAPLGEPAPRWAVLPGLGSAALLAGYWFLRRSGWKAG